MDDDRDLVANDDKEDCEHDETGISEELISIESEADIGGDLPQPPGGSH